MPNQTSFILTYFKMPELINSHFEKLSKLEDFRYIIGQIEVCPKSNRNHIQAYIEFSKKKSRKFIKDILPGIHVEGRKGTRKQARDYCCKVETRISKGTPLEIGNWKTEQGRRTDLIEIKEVVATGKSLPKIILEDCKNYQSMRMVEKIFQYKAKARDYKDPPEVRWYYGESGAGKTFEVYKEFKEEDIYSSFSYKWWDGYYQQKVILIDDFRRDYCKFHHLLKLIDRYPHTVEIKGGTTQINSPIIIITSPYHPKEVYFTREDKYQLIRRIDLIKEFRR